jgi:acyl-CoA thioester hydrolase
LAQVKPPATLDLGFRIAKMGRTSLRTEAGMFLGERCVAVTRGVIVWYDYKKSQALPIPNGVRDRIRKQEVKAPEESA